MKKMRAVLLGFGGRGAAYAKFAEQYPEELEIVAVAEPVENRRATAKERLGLLDDQLYSDWREIAAQPKMADFAIITTLERLHCENALAMIEKGYDLLLEKPMAPAEEECKAITSAAVKKGVKVVICHVLRYAPFWIELKNAIDNGAVGKIMSVIHQENVGTELYSHAFVRGTWRTEELGAPMILAKCSHDVDLLQWLIGGKCKKVQSFGSLTHFTSDNRPLNAPLRCNNRCPAAAECPYFVDRIYRNKNQDNLHIWYRRCVAGTVAPPTDAQVDAALEKGNYGRCVYACDNDVVDHQIVNMEFDDGCTAVLSMNGFNAPRRFIQIFGTKGELIGDAEEGTFRIYSFEKEEWTFYTPETEAEGHGGGDKYLMRELMRYFQDLPCGKSICDVQTSYENHMIAFAAEKSRHTGTVVDMDEFCKY